MKYLTLFFAALLLAIPVSAQEDDTLTIVTYDSFALSEETLQAFEEEAGVTVEIVRLADAGILVNQAVLTKNNPLGDVLYGVDNTFLSRALENNIFIPYEATGLDTVPDEFKLDTEDFRVTPVTFGDVCLNYDVAYVEQENLDLPESLLDLTKPEYKGMLVVENPATSSPGLAFLMTIIAVFGEEGDYTYLDYWQDLRDNDVLVVDGWSEAYYGEFTAGSENGTYPFVVSYASSPPVEVLFAEDELDQAPTGAIVADDTCFRQIEFAGILDGTDNLEAAQKFIDFTLSETFQADLPLQMFVYPVVEDIELPEIFTEYSQIPENPVTIPYEDIDANREAWIQAWTETVLR